MDSDSPMLVSRNLPLIVPILNADIKDVFYFLFYFIFVLHIEIKYLRLYFEHSTTFIKLKLKTLCTNKLVTPFS